MAEPNIWSLLSASPEEKLEWFKHTFSSPALFALAGCGIRLRSYQREAAGAIIASILGRLGHSLVVIFPRQSGKNELQAHIEAYLLAILCDYDVEMVKVSPTWKPQSLNAMRRLERVLRNNNLIKMLQWRKESGYIYRLGRARLSFLSGAPGSNVVGATASILLQCDEAQDVEIAKWDKEFNPMAASTNATRLYWGTAWTARTLLAREKRLAQRSQESDGMQRLFETDAEAVRVEVPAYGRFVDGEVRKLGREHPFIRTQFFSQEIDGQGGMFPPERLALMLGDHPAHTAAQPGETYAFLIDVGGQDESTRSDPVSMQEAPTSQSRHNATALTIVAIDLSGLDDPLVEAPRYRVVGRRLWFGLRHSEQYARIKALVEAWAPARIVIDATGLGEGLASFLARAIDGGGPGKSGNPPRRVLQFKFSLASKSALGWEFIAAIESGRYKEYRTPSGDGDSIGTPSSPDDGYFPPTGAGGFQNDGSSAALLQALFFEQARAAQMDVLPGPNRHMRWGVPDRTPHPLTGEPLNDDLLVSAALACALDRERWGTAESAVVYRDPLAGMLPVV